MLVAAIVRFELSSMQSKEWKESHWQESYCMHGVKRSLWRGSSCAIVLLLVALRVVLQANHFNSMRYIIAGLSMSSTLVWFGRTVAYLWIGIDSHLMLKASHKMCPHCIL